MSESFRIEGNMLVSGDEKCHNCNGTGKAQETVHIICAKCGGTGNGPRGGKNGCKSCYGSGKKWTKTDTIVDCDRCKGAGKYPATHTSSLPEGMYRGLPMKVYRQNRDITFNESLLGIGCVHSTVDYGNAWDNLSDEELVEKERESTHWVQACKISRKTDADGVFELCDHVGIFVNRGGYSVRPVYASEIPGAQIALERSYDEGMAVGMKIAAEGGNGTIGGAFHS